MKRINEFDRVVPIQELREDLERAEARAAGAERERGEWKAHAIRLSEELSLRTEALKEIEVNADISGLTTLTAALQTLSAIQNAARAALSPADSPEEDEG